MKVSKSKAVVRLFIISLISLVTLTGCLEDTYSRPAHEVGKLLGADSSNIVLDYPIGTIGGSAPYCLYFTPKQKLSRADIDRITQSLSYTVTVQEILSNNVSTGDSTSCGMHGINKYGHRSKVKFNSIKLLRGDHLAASDIPRQFWMISKWHISETLSTYISVEQLDYTPSNAVLEIDGKPITRTLVIIQIW